ncbi:MAG: DUF3341 domain-containing protein [Planctomycetes bacterium]|nr:DUF3341 domain-containing protein [Planctomycetota bacterium]
MSRLSYSLRALWMGVFNRRAFNKLRWKFGLEPLHYWSEWPLKGGIAAKWQDSEQCTSRVLVGVFGDQDHVLEATRECREAGFMIHDVYVPYAVHGLDEAMGLRRSRLTWVTFIMGALAGAFALFGQYYTQAIDWPINVGGKDPWHIHAYVPVTFEFVVLIGGLSTMLALFIRSKLYPGKKAKLCVEGTTDDKFALALAQRCTGFDHERARALFAKHHVERVMDLGDTP